MPRRKCKECGAKLETDNDRVQYCDDHRRREKFLQQIEGIHQCPTCLRIVQRCEAELGLVLDEIEKIPSATAQDVEHSRWQYFKARGGTPPTPTRYERYVERLGLRAAEMAASRKMLTVESMSEMARMHRSTIRRHLDQHLIPLGYMERAGRRIDIGPMLGQGLPRYNLYFAPDRTRWLPPIGYFGFTEADIDDDPKEFKKLHQKLNLVSEELIVFWIRTRLRLLEEAVPETMCSDGLDIERKAVILYGIRLAIEPVLKNVLSDYAPALSESGKGVDIFRRDISRIAKPTLDEEIEDFDRIGEIVNQLETRKSPLLKERWAQAMIDEVVNFVQRQLTFDPPTVIIDWKREGSL